jgi:intracellular sulfur oxidation DsrE/DsrF family protein
VFVAGDTFSLEQAFADATLEKLGGASGFTIVATQREAAKLTEKGAKPGVKTAVRQFQQAGGHFYLCDRDLAAARLAAKDVLPGVKVERALTKQEQQATSAQDAELRRVRRACS